MDTTVLQELREPGDSIIVDTFDITRNSKKRSVWIKPSNKTCEKIIISAISQIAIVDNEERHISV